ncbi:MAG: hypothetical protein JWO06_1643 [Bacteroidota bacterium]|nr:hypothetical protein [Bacteroidota bacterium]
MTFLLGAKAFSQFYRPFPERNASWTDRYYFCEDPMGGNATIDNNHFFLNGDTVIYGLVYHSLMREGNQYYGNCNGQHAQSFISFGLSNAGYIREDSMKKVYYLFFPSSTEEILYDFNLAVGDSFLATTFINAPAFISVARVLSIDTFFSNGVYRRYNFEVFDTSQNRWFNANSWIEGIGSSAGLLCPFFNYSRMGAGDQELICFGDSSGTVYPSFSLQSCALVTALIEQKVKIKLLNIYPNPANDYCTIQLDGLENSYTAQFVDITGQEIMTFKITNPTTQIPISNLPAGLYFVKVSDALGHVGVGKLVKE